VDGALGAYHVCKVSQHLRIQRIRLRQLPGGFREVPDLPWIRDHDRQARRRQRASQRQFDSARGFQNDQVGGSAARRASSSMTPASVFDTVNRPPGRCATSNCAFETSMPTKRGG
jgi:hypothetical protein